MNRETLKLGAAILALLAVFVMWMNDRPIEHLPGVLAADAPQQDQTADAEPWQVRGYEIRPLADYSLMARVLSAERYRWDRGAELAPVDLAVGWGVMSDTDVLGRFEIEQGARFYTLYPQDGSIDVHQALRHSANMHLIPADDSVLQRLRSVRTGHLVTLRGRLVGVKGESGFTWRSSLRRDDTGAGACELMWVDEVEVR